MEFYTSWNRSRRVDASPPIRAKFSKPTARDDNHPTGVAKLGGSLRQEMTTIRQELQRLVGSLRQEMTTIRQELQSLRQEMTTIRQELQSLVGSLRQEMTTIRQELQSLVGRVAALEYAVAPQDPVIDLCVIDLCY